MVRRFFNRIARRKSFRADSNGAAAVEFALVVVPFLGLMGSIVETGFMFLSRQALEQATVAAGRAVMVGEVARQPGTAAAKETFFKNKLCDGASWFIACSDILYDVRPYASFAAADLTSPVANGNFDTTGLPRFQPGNAGDIVVVRAYYKRPIYVDYLGANIGYLNGKYFLVIATSVFKSES